MDDWKILERQPNYVRLQHRHTGEVRVIDRRDLFDIFEDAVLDSFDFEEPYKAPVKAAKGLGRWAKRMWNGF